MLELRPCPFCGNEDINWQQINPNPFTKTMMWVFCRKCGGAMLDTNEDHCMNDTKEKWNRRKE